MLQLFFLQTRALHHPIHHTSCKVPPQRVSAAQHSTPHTVADVLPWLTDTQGAIPSPPLVRVQSTPNAGNTLVAGHDIPPHATILALPCASCIVQPLSSTDEDSAALGPMAMALLRRRAAGTDPWLASLPASVDLPWMTWEPHELDALQDDETLLEVGQLQQRMSCLYETYSSELKSLSMDFSHLSWAYSMILSRSFRLPPPHNLRVLAPGIDLCNHDFAPTATVKHTTSPDASQGLAALADVADVEGGSVGGPRMELVAGGEGVRGGEEVSICYHTHANDVFLLYYGFLPADNPNDCVVLFGTIEEAIVFVDEEVFPETPPVGDVKTRARLLQLALSLEFAEIESWHRLFVSQQGFDQRLLIVIDALSRQHMLGWPLLDSSVELARGEGPAELPTRALDSSIFDELAPEELQAEGYEILCLRCESLLSSYPTTLEADARMLQQLRSARAAGNSTQQGGDGGNGGEGGEGGVSRLHRQQVALQYRMNKKRVLLNAIQYMRSVV